MREGLGTGYFNAVDHHVLHVQQSAQGPLHLCGGYVLPLPAERVPGAVLEVHVATLVHDQDVAWTRPEEEEGRETGGGGGVGTMGKQEKEERGDGTRGDRGGVDATEEEEERRHRWRRRRTEEETEEE